MTYREIFFLKSEKVKQYQFNPQPDITAYELSLLLPITQPRYGRTLEDIGEKLSKMPIEIMRHINIVK
jgi:hypothetical protein